MAATSPTLYAWRHGQICTSGIVRLGGCVYRLSPVLVGTRGAAKALGSSPPGGGRLRWGGEAQPGRSTSLHPHPSPPPSRERGHAGALAVLWYLLIFFIG